MSGHYDPNLAHTAGVVVASPLADVSADQIPAAWREILSRSGLDSHPADLVWVSTAVMGDRSLDAVLTTDLDITHREPPIPCGWAVFQRPLRFGAYRHDGGAAHTALLCSVEWSHRDDGTVLMTGSVAFRAPTGQLDSGVVIAVATRDGRPGLLPFGEATRIGGGTLVTGDPVPPPMTPTAEDVPRKAQRMLAAVMHRVWTRWESPRGAYTAGVLSLSGDDAGQRHSPSWTTPGAPVRVVVLSRRGERFPELGELPRWERPRNGPDHRWQVRGHYRNQVCGRGGRDRRRIWVPEHVSGPPGKPVRQTDTVLALR